LISTPSGLKDKVHKAALLDNSKQSAAGYSLNVQVALAPASPGAVRAPMQQPHSAMR
jgi:hypothetical protein